jgi:hypothetical protein
MRQHDRIAPRKIAAVIWHVFLRRCGNLGLLLVLDGGLLEVLGGIVGGVLLLGGLGAGAGVAVGGGLAGVLGGAVGGVGLGLEAVDFGLCLGDVLLIKS